MKLSGPFQISARLLPAVQVEKDWLSLDPDTWVAYLDCADGNKYTIRGLRPPQMQCADSSHPVQAMMGALCGFLGAAAESYAYGLRSGKPGENADLFEPAVTEWAYQHSDELSMLSCQLEEEDEETGETPVYVEE